MKVKINLHGETYKYLENPSGQKVAGLISMLKGKKGYCEVIYSREYKNSFEFDGEKDLRNKLLPCVETALVKEFSNGRI